MKKSWIAVWFIAAAAAFALGYASDVGKPRSPGSPGSPKAPGVPGTVVQAPVATSIAPQGQVVASGSLLAPYYAFQDALVNDGAPEALASAAQSLAAAAGSLSKATPAIARLYDSLRTLPKEQNLVAMRQRFSAISMDLQKVMDQGGNPDKAASYLFFCPMALGGKGAVWLQADTTLRNPYFGKTMLGCGEKRRDYPAAK